MIERVVKGKQGWLSIEGETGPINIVAVINTEG